MTTLLPFSFRFVTTLLDKQNSGVCENEPCKPRVLTAIRPVWCGRTVALTRGVCLAPEAGRKRGCVGHLLRQGQAHTPVTLAQAGKVSSSNIALPQLLMAIVMQRMPMMFMTIPVFAYGGELRTAF